MYSQKLSQPSRYFVGERSDMMWRMVSFSTRQIRHVSSSSTLKTCFLIYLVEIVCSWIVATVDSIDLFRVEYFSHWLNRSLSTSGCSRYFANCPCIFFLLSSTSSLLMRADLMVNFRGNSSSQPIVEYHDQFHHNNAVSSGGQIFLLGLPASLMLAS